MLRLGALTLSPRRFIYSAAMRDAFARFSLAGLFGAAFVPTRWGLGLAGTLALLVPLAKGRPALTGVFVASFVAVAASPLPMRLGLLLAVTCGIVSAPAAWARWLCST